jgi:hypothetical protein
MLASWFGLYCAVPASGLPPWGVGRGGVGWVTVEIEAGCLNTKDPRISEGSLIFSLGK